MKKILTILSACSLVLIVAFIVTVSPPANTSEAAGQAGPTFALASSTTFTLTTTSQRLLATTTTPKRYGATIQPINCTAPAYEGVFMKLGTDQAATAGNGFNAFASTTSLFGDHVNSNLNVQGSVQGITRAGTCTVLVTEWRGLF